MRNILKINNLKIIVIFFCFLFCTMNSVAKHVANQITNDSISQTSPKARVDSVQQTKLMQKDSTKLGGNAFNLEAEVHCQAKDSMILFANGQGMLYGEGQVEYYTPSPIKLTADFIRVRMDSNAVYAVGRVDSTGNVVGSPVFSQGSQSYDAKYISYNFKTQKGYIQGGVTKQGEGYVVSKETKRNNDNTMFIRNGQYTTCELHDHPHYYMQLTKAKVRPGSYIAAGPAYMVIADIPLPLAIPFGFFPFTNSYSSGIIMPSYGDEMQRGFFLKNGGYYFAINDYFDLELTGDIYTKGTWAINAASRYKKRYKYSGSIRANYREDVTGEKGLPNYVSMRNFKLNWTHRQDQKASKYSTFGASVDFATSGYNRSNVNNYYNPNLQSKNITSSSVNYTKRFPESPWTLSANVNLQQRTQDSTLSMTLPNITASMSRIYPFKRKHGVGEEHFYEKIALSYNMTMSNSLTAKEDEFMEQNIIKDWKNGIKHKLPISASFNTLKYITIAPSMSNNLRWYFNKVNKDWDVSRQEEVKDTTYGFYNVYDFNLGVNASTKLYGYWIPSRKLFGDKIDRIRHVITPSIGFSYHPDFGSDQWGYYDKYEKAIVDKNSSEVVRYEEVIYSPFENGLYGKPSVGISNSLNFSLSNNLEMKVKSKNDTTENTFRKISLIDNFTIGGSYNFASDSMRLSLLNASLRLKLTKTLSLNLRGSFDPYMYRLDQAGNPQRVDELRWFHGRAPRFLGTGSSFQYSINNDTFKRDDSDKESENPNEEDTAFNPNGDSMASDGTGDRHSKDKKKKRKTEMGSDGYVKVDIPWNFSINYSFNWRESRKKEDFDIQAMAYKRKYTHNISFSGNVSPTPKWRISYTGSLNLTNPDTEEAFDLNKIQITQMTMSIMRDLHCWRLSASVTPFGYYTSYMVTIGVNASMLEDLKYEKRSDASSDVKWF